MKTFCNSLNCISLYCISCILYIVEKVVVCSILYCHPEKDTFLMAVLNSAQRSSLTSSPKRRRFNTTECWTSTPYHLVPTDNCKCQNKSLFSYETTSGVKVPQTNCISMHGNPMFFINQPLVLNSWIGVPELQKKSPWKLTATVSAVKATKRSLPCIAVLVPGSNAFGVAYF